MSMPGWLENLRGAQGLPGALAGQAPALAAAAVAVLLAVQAGWLLTLRNTGPAEPLVPRASTTSQPVAPAFDAATVAGAHLFGETNAAVGGEAPPSTAQLVLAGVLAVPDPRQGMAIIGQSAAATRLYATGAAIAPGLVLHSVYADRVLLDRGGRLEALALPRKPASQAPPASVAPQLQGPAQRLAALAQSGDGSLLGGLVRAQPVFNGGKLSGYHIFPGGRATASSFTQLGLRGGDLVTAVNGSPLDDPSHANDILQTLSSSASATLTVMRDGRTQDVQLNLETVAADAERATAEAAAAQAKGGAFAAPVGAGRMPGLSLNPARNGAVQPQPESPPPGN